MHKISCNGDEVYILKNFLSNKECDKYFKMIDDIGYNAKPIPWEERAVEITTDPIVDKVTKYINERFNLNLIVEQAETQNHNINSYSVFHVHDHEVRKHIVYNSLLYLNDNFEGGHYLTKNGIKLKPEKGMLTFFNGQKIYHGVEKVLKNDRKTLIFWWRSPSNYDTNNINKEKDV